MPTSWIALKARLTPRRMMKQNVPGRAQHEHEQSLLRISCTADLVLRLRSARRWRLLSRRWRLRSSALARVDTPFIGHSPRGAARQRPGGDLQRRNLQEPAATPAWALLIGARTLVSCCAVVSRCHAQGHQPRSCAAKKISSEPRLHPLLSMAPSGDLPGRKVGWREGGKQRTLLPSPFVVLWPKGCGPANAYKSSGEYLLTYLLTYFR